MSTASSKARSLPICQQLYGLDDELGSNAIPVHVHYLRKKLQEAKTSAEIHTVRGVGYLLTETKQ
jgi:DNA-binding response OmpR family regulator